MIDLHMHSIWSDGALVPAELVQRAAQKGVRAMAITDHVDHSNIELVVPALAKFCARTACMLDLTVLPGMELTHVPPESIKDLADRGRRLGARWIVVHGQTPVEPVPEGTNRAAIQAGVDLLAHPGIIEPGDVKLAAQMGVTLEITARKGHCLANGRVAALAKKHGAQMIVNTDAHDPSDLIGIEHAKVVALGAGLSAGDFKKMIALSGKLVKKAAGKKS